MTKKVIIILLITGLIISCLTIFWPINQDEGVFLTIASKVNGGWLPYRDIFDHKGPGIYYLMALLLKFKDNYIWLRFFFLIINILTGLIIFFISRKFMKSEFAFLASTLWLVFLPILEGNFMLTEVPMTFFIALSGLFCLKWKTERKKIYLVIIGLCVGLASIFKQPGIITFISVLCFFWSEKYLLKKISIIFLVILFLWTALTGFFWAKGEISSFFNQVVESNIINYHATNLLLRFKTWLFIMLQMIPILIIIPTSIKFLNKEQRKFFLGFALLPIPFLLKREYPHYFLQIFPYIIVISVIGISKLKDAKKYMLVLFIFGLLLFRNFIFVTYIDKNPLKKERTAIANKLKGKGGCLFYRTEVGEYYLLNMTPLTKYLYVNELNNKDGQAEIINKIKNGEIRYILWTESSDWWKDPYAYSLNKYIYSNYEPIDYYPRMDLVLYKLNAQ